MHSWQMFASNYYFVQAIHKVYQPQTVAMFKKLRTVIYYVPDLRQAKDWYIGLTGTQPYFDEPYYVGFDFDGCELGLHPRDESVTQGNQTVTHWAVSGIELCVTKMVKHGASILYPTSDVGGGVKVATLLDPWDNAVGLIEINQQA